MGYTGEQQSPAQDPGVNRQVSFDNSAVLGNSLAGVSHEQLINSGVNMLTHMGLDNNTTDFIATHAARAKGIPHVQRPQINHDNISDSRGLGGEPGRRTGANIASMTAGGITAGTGMDRGTDNMGVTGFARGNMGHELAVQESDGESSISSSFKKPKRVQSGMVAKPINNIKTKEIWPHYNLTYGFVTAEVQYHQISFEQYIVGETKTIMQSSDPVEIRGRLSLMTRIAYLKYRGYNCPNLHTLYAAIINSIERHEDTWASEWRHIEDMVLELPDRKTDKGNQKGGKPKSSEQWYCRNYNREEGCNLPAPHEAMVHRRHRNVKHFCARCWSIDSEFRDHAECDPACPHKQE